MPTLALLIALIVLTPLIPAFVLYRVLPPGRTIVKGPFKGLQLHVTGASGGYLLIAVGIAFFTSWYLKPGFKMWTVQGPRGIETDHGVDVQLCMSPPVQDRPADGTYTIQNVPVPIIDQGGPPPRLLVYKSGYKLETIPLTDRRTFGAKTYDVTVRELESIFVVNTPIKLEREHEDSPYPHPVVSAAGGSQ